MAGAGGTRAAPHFTRSKDVMHTTETHSPTQTMNGRQPRRTTYHHIGRSGHSFTEPNTTAKGNTGARETHPTAHTDDRTNGPPEPRQTHGSTIYLSLTGHSGGLPLGTTDCKRPAAGEELPYHHCAPGHGIWHGRTSAVGVKSSCMQIWVPTGFRSFAAVANPTQSARQAVMNAVPCL